MEILLTGGSRRFQDILAGYLNLLEGIHICGMADTPAAAFRLCREKGPDLVILDTNPDCPLFDSAAIRNLRSVSELMLLTVHSDSGIDAIVEVIRRASGDRRTGSPMAGVLSCIKMKADPSRQGVFES